MTWNGGQPNNMKVYVVRPKNGCPIYRSVMSSSSAFTNTSKNDEDDDQRVRVKRCVLSFFYKKAAEYNARTINETIYNDREMLEARRTIDSTSTGYPRSPLPLPIFVVECVNFNYLLHNCKTTSLGLIVRERSNSVSPRDMYIRPEREPRDEIYMALEKAFIQPSPKSTDLSVSSFFAPPSDHQ